MISLHSCFVAGLTLVYCIWRDRKLFSYEVVEATQSCSQILTIFGEKWPGAVKYRDIFDALSQGLFKLTLQPEEAMYHSRSSLSPQLNINTQPHIASQTTSTWRSTGAPMSSQTPLKGKPTMSHLVTDAVKEAFMEVDEEAPGGWQGWKIWNEMVTDDSNSTSHPASGLNGHDNQEPTETSWNAYSGSGVYGTDPVQDAAMQMSDGFMMDHGQWGLAGYS
jgi:hypothetical protein